MQLNDEINDYDGLDALTKCDFEYDFDVKAIFVGILLTQFE